MANVVVLGASGATGRWLVKRLISKNIAVTAIVRNALAFKASLKDQSLDLNTPSRLLTIVEADISSITDERLAEHMLGCDAVLSCLGHNLSFKGIFGKPRRLVTDAAIKATQVMRSNPKDKKTKFILMNTTGNTNLDIPEKPPFSQRIVVALLRLLLPPQADNEDAANFLRLHIGQNNPSIEWVVVRPDGLIDEDAISPIDIFKSPTRNPIFNAGQTSRINVAEFMAELVANPNLWNQWKGKMPVIYNTENSSLTH